MAAERPLTGEQLSNDILNGLDVSCVENSASWDNQYSAFLHNLRKNFSYYWIPSQAQYEGPIHMGVSTYLKGIEAGDNTAIKLKRIIEEDVHLPQSNAAILAKCILGGIVFTYLRKHQITSDASFDILTRDLGKDVDGIIEARSGRRGKGIERGLELLGHLLVDGFTIKHQESTRHFFGSFAKQLVQS